MSRPPSTVPCAVAGCAGTKYCRRMCKMHYSRLRKRGNVGSPDREKGIYGAGTIDANGYRLLQAPGHPLAQRVKGRVFEHRIVLFDAIGPGVHECHWCSTPVAWFDTADASTLVTDHVDRDRLNNVSSNLVPSCIPCNVTRPN